MSEQPRQARRPRDADLFEPASGQCPKCGEDLPAGAFWQRVRAPEGRHPAWRCRHLRASGEWCVAHAGPAVEQAAAEGEGKR